MLLPDKNIVSAINATLDIELQEGISGDELKKMVSGYINPLIANNFNKLISILYRLDINETKLVQLLHDNPGEDAGMIIADLIIERQLQKFKSRKEDTGNNIIPENDKW